jgi:hypothetical protein
MRPRDRRSTLLARLGGGAFWAGTECLLYWLGEFPPLPFESAAFMYDD